MDGCNKLWNLIVTERESGKTTLMWKKAYNTYKDKNRPSIIVKRFGTEITQMWLDGAATIISDFTNQSVSFKYNSGDFRSGGILDIYLVVDGQEFKTPFCRIIALNVKMRKLKSQVLNNPRYIMIDEFIINKRLGEDYLSDEVLRIQEGVYTTYLRYVPKKDLTIYLFGNPYSLFNPYFMYLNIDTSKVYPGSFIVGENYVEWSYQIKPELKEKLLRDNKMYQFDDAYKKYAFDGRAIQDADVKIIKQPEGFKLQYIFKIKDTYIGIYRGYQLEPERIFFYAKIINRDEVSKRRDVICFDFGQMADRTVLFNSGNKALYYSFKSAVEHRQIGFASVNESWLIEEIYQEL